MSRVVHWKHGQRQHQRDTLAETGGRDPTRTTTLRRNYASKLRAGYGRINAKIRDGVRSRDVFGLTRDTLAEDVPFMRFDTDDQKIEQFREWLRRQQDREVLSVIGTERNQFVRSGYQSGLRQATTKLRQAGVDVDQRPMEQVFNLPEHRDTVQHLYTRDFTQLEGITQAVSQQSSRVLSEAFVEGVNPTEAARRLTDRVDSIGKTRATTLARTSIIDAHTQAMLTRYERFNEQLDGVTVSGEFTTAGDDRVCPTCAALEGEVFTLQQARSGTFEFEGRGFPMRPPIHANCRCTILPVTS